jgi:DNA-binding LytR/AlgR family response regulator
MKSKGRIFIAEDNVLISEQLCDVLEELDYTVLEIGYDLMSSIGILSRTSPNIAILDIRMHGTNEGFEIAKYINENIHIPIVFLTSYSDVETLKAASTHHPSAYLVKPFRKEQIFSTLEILSSSKKMDEQKITLNLGREKRIIPVNDILWLMTDDKYIEIQTVSKKFVVRASIASFMSENELTNLERVHRSYAVNPNKIESISGSSLFINGSEIPISRKHFSRIKEVFA